MVRVSSAGRTAREPRRGRAGSSGDDEFAEDAGVFVAGSECGADEDRRDDAEQGERAERLLEVFQASGGPVVCGVLGVQADQDEVRDDHGHDREEKRGDDEASPLFSDSGADEPRGATRLSVVAVKLCGIADCHINPEDPRPAYLCLCPPAGRQTVWHRWALAEWLDRMERPQDWAGEPGSVGRKLNWRRLSGLPQNLSSKTSASNCSQAGSHPAN